MSLTQGLGPWTPVTTLHPRTMSKDDTIQTRLRQKQTTVQYPNKQSAINKTLPTVTHQHVITLRHAMTHVTTSAQTHQHPALSPLLLRQGGGWGEDRIVYAFIDGPWRWRENVGNTSRSEFFLRKVTHLVAKMSLLADKISHVTTTGGGTWSRSGVGSTRLTRETLFAHDNIMIPLTSIYHHTHLAPVNLKKCILMTSSLCHCMT